MPDDTNDTPVIGWEGQGIAGYGVPQAGTALDLALVATRSTDPALRDAAQALRYGGLVSSGYDFVSGLSAAAPSGAAAYLTGPAGETFVDPASGVGTGQSYLPVAGAALDVGLEAAFSKKPKYQQGLDAAMDAVAAGFALTGPYGWAAALAAQLGKQHLDRLIGEVNTGDWDHFIVDQLTPAGAIEDVAGLFGVHDMFGFGPSDAWTTFPKRLSRTLRGEYTAGTKLIADMKAAKTTSEITAAISRYNAAVQKAGVGDYATNTKRALYGPAGYQIRALPGATGKPHEGKVKINWENPAYGVKGVSPMGLLADAIQQAVTRVGTPPTPTAPASAPVPQGGANPFAAAAQETSGISDANYADYGWTLDSATGLYTAPSSRRYIFSGGLMQPVVLAPPPPTGQDGKGIGGLATAPRYVTAGGAPIPTPPAPGPAPEPSPALDPPKVALVPGGVNLARGLRGLSKQAAGWTYDATTGLFSNPQGQPQALTGGLMSAATGAPSDWKVTAPWTVNPSGAGGFLVGPQGVNAPWSTATIDFLAGKTDVLPGILEAVDTPAAPTPPVAEPSVKTATGTSGAPGTRGRGGLGDAVAWTPQGGGAWQTV